jgi:putative hydrolases of HD superfamily
MDDILRIKKFYELKNVDRYSSVKNRKESSAEHSWSCLVLADYFLSKTKRTLDRLHIYELLMYHDVVEIYAGDSPLHPDITIKKKRERELAAMKRVAKEIPKELKRKYVSLVSEFEENKTPEARFARAIDVLDAEIHEIDYKQDWKGFTEAFLRKNKEHYFEGNPELKEAFERIMVYLKENGYFEQ